MALAAGFLAYGVPREARRPGAVSGEGLLGKLRAASLAFRVNLGASVKQVWNRPELAPYFATQVAIQFMLQPVFHYWQPYFKSWDSVGVTADRLGSIFFAYVGAQLIVSLLVSEWVKRGLFSAERILGFQTVATTLCFAVMGLSENLAVSLLAFLAMQGMVGTIRSLLSASFNREIPSEQRAAVLSSVSLVSRLGMLGSLVLLGSAVKHFPVRSLYLLSALGSFALVILVWKWQRRVQENPRTTILPKAARDSIRAWASR